MIDWSKAVNVAARQAALAASKAQRRVAAALREADAAYAEALDDNRSQTVLRAIQDYRKALRAWAKSPVGDMPTRVP